MAPASVIDSSVFRSFVIESSVFRSFSDYPASLAKNYYFTEFKIQLNITDNTFAEPFLPVLHIMLDFLYPLVVHRNK